MTLADENWNYFTGDTIEYWNGPQVSDENIHAETKKQFKTNLERIFHSQNLCKRFVGHYTNALVGQDFAVSLKSKDGSAVPEIVDKLFKSWISWQNNSKLRKGKNRTRTLVRAVQQMLVRDEGDGDGVGYLRLYSPKKLRRLYGKGDEKYKQIVFHCPPPGSIKTKRDEDDGLYWARYTFRDKADKIRTEDYELLEDGRTLVTYDKEQSKNPETDVFNYDNQLPIVELVDDCLLTSDLKSIQRAINKLLTGWDSNLEFAGFRERVILGGDYPGHWVTENGKEKYVYDDNPQVVGPKNLLMIQGVPIGDRRTPTDYTNPAYTTTEPVDVDNFVKSLEAYKLNAHEVVGLGHLLLGSDGRVSGVSRISIKEDYVSDLKSYKTTIEQGLVEIFTMGLLVLAPLYPELALEEYVPVVELKLSIQPLPEERRENREDVAAGILPKSDAIEGLQKDPEITKLKILQEQKEELQLSIDRHKELEKNGIYLRNGTNPQTARMENTGSTEGKTDSPELEAAI